ncbi:MAG: DUF421 domain-containing protein [Chloroflexi bacterium]|nr:DUF421 domain-containing protein [Chloroflexota bacterium]
MNPVLGILLRLVLLYVFFLILLRISGKRTISLGKLGSRENLSPGTSFDFVIALIASDLPDDIIFGEVPVAQGVVAIGTLLSLHVLVSFLAYQVPFIGRLVDGKPQLMMQAGEPHYPTMRRERISALEFDAELRLKSIDDLAQVKEAWLEPTGTVSIARQPFAKAVQRADVHKNGSE